MTLLGGRNKNFRTVILKFLDRLEDVVHDAVRLMLIARHFMVERIPAANQLLDRTHIDRAVVKVRLELRHVLHEKPPVLPDRIPAKR